jgi:trimeric autotransporter adhesin
MNRFVLAAMIVALELPAQEPAPTSIELPSSTICGTNVKGKVNLSGPAQSDPFEIEVTSNQPTTIDIKPPVTAAKGATFAPFEVKCLQATQPMPVTITARNRSGGIATATLQVLAPVLQTLSVQPHTGGASVQGQVTLIGRAPTGGVVVTLSSNSTSATVPQSVTVLSGQSSAPFTVTTRVVSQPTTVNILGTGLGVSKTVDLIVQPPAPTSVTFHLKTGQIISSAGVIGGSQKKIKVTLSNVPRSGQIVSLTSSNPGVIPVPATVTFDGSSAEHSFDVNTSAVAQSTTVNITATTGETSSVGSLRVLVPAIEQVSVSPTTATGGQVAQLRITLNGDAPAIGFAGSVVTNNPGVVTVPSEFRVPAGAREVSVPVQVSRIDAPAEATITAGAGGIKSNALLKIEPEGPTSISIQPTTLIGGAKVIATVTRVSSPEPLTVILSSDNTAVTVPASVTFDPGSASKQIPLGTDAVPSHTIVTITAKKGAVVKTGSIWMNPPAVTQLTLSPTSITDGQYVTAQFSINRPAPAGLAVHTTTRYNGMTFTRDATVAVNSTTGSIRLGPFFASQQGTIYIDVETSSGRQSASATVYPP